MMKPSTRRVTNRSSWKKWKQTVKRNWLARGLVCPPREGSLVLLTARGNGTLVDKKLAKSTSPGRKHAMQHLLMWWTLVSI